jgi:hypothetical protein
MAVSALSIGLLLLGAGTTRADQREKGEKGKNRPEASLQLPITGTAAGGVIFTGTLSVKKFVAQDGRAMAIAMVAGAATSGGAPLGTVLAGPIALPVSVQPGSPITTTAASIGAPVAAQATCQVLHLELAAVNLDVLGLQVTTQPVVLDLAADAAGTNILGQLVCTVLETVGNVIGLVDLLNQILGLLTGLLGALIPG